MRYTGTELLVLDTTLMTTKSIAWTIIIKLSD